MTAVYRWSFSPVQRGGVGSTSSWMDSLRTSYRRERMEDKKDLAQEVLVKVIFDQLFFQAFFLNLYLFSTAMFEGRTLKETYSRCKRDFHAAWGYSIAFWMPAQTVNFSLIPAKNQALFVMSLNAVWQTILSILYHQRDYGPPPTAEAEEGAEPSAATASAESHREEAAPTNEEVMRLTAEVARLSSQSAEQVAEIWEQRQQIENLLQVVEVQTKSLRAICESRFGEDSVAVLSALSDCNTKLPDEPVTLEDAHTGRWVAATASLSAAAGGLLLFGTWRRGDH